MAIERFMVCWIHWLNIHFHGSVLLHSKKWNVCIQECQHWNIITSFPAKIFFLNRQFLAPLRLFWMLLVLFCTTLSWTQVQAKLSGSQILYTDAYNPLMDMIKNPNRYGNNNIGLEHFFDQWIVWDFYFLVCFINQL